MKTLEDEDNDYRSRQIGQASESIDYTSKRIETTLREWEQNQRWQLNHIRKVVETISKTVAFIGFLVLIVTLTYIKQALNW